MTAGATPPKPTERILTDLDLNGDAPVRVQPRLGPWGPRMVPSTSSKKRWRWLIYVIFVLALAAVMGWGYYTFVRMRQM